MLLKPRRMQYLPIMSVRPAEIRALTELPNKCKDALTPFIILKPWASAHFLSSAIQQAESALGERNWIADVALDSVTSTTIRPVHHEIAALRDPKNGYDNWYSFVAEKPNVIPCALIGDLTQLPFQIQKLSSLNRGIVIRVKLSDIEKYDTVIQTAAQYINSDQLLFVFDFEHRGRELLASASQADAYIKKFSQFFPSGNMCVSATTFPSDFASRTEQEIYERLLYNELSKNTHGVNLIYSDHASTRVDPLGGGGGGIYPRIDYPLEQLWKFRRSSESITGVTEVEKISSYTKLAASLIREDFWDKKLRLWGVQMIEKIANGDPTGAMTPARCTAVRINIHLHRQLYYGKPESEKYDTDESWDDF
ncbi:beta family protein [Ancylobacter sp. A5.8]|uniref:beta family protein n=1 Tax=Ancylobacter gelatini TaxID=2919920 RepID=UPI001F4E23B4|nr:beta family protein [Ancylobacter gelatini]MCJ8143840.1 beta family protein [Ancylobacter gelatini]